MMNMERITELHDSFMKFIKTHPNMHFMIITDEQMYVYDKKDDIFISTNGEERIDLFNRKIYHYIPEKNAFIVCLISFETFDEVLEYISMKTYKNDYKKYIENVVRINTEMF